MATIPKLYWQRHQRDDGTYGRALHAFPWPADLTNFPKPWRPLCGQGHHDMNWAIVHPKDSDPLPASRHCCARCYAFAHMRPGTVC